MKIAILSPGPSLKLFPTKNDYDILVGVNRAANYIDCDYLSIYNDFNWEYINTNNKPIILTQTWEYCRMIDNFGLIGLDNKRYKIENMVWPDIDGVEHLSFTVAIVFAINKSNKGSVIDCYGNDFKGNEDFDGYSTEVNKKNRIASNFDKTIIIYNQLVDYAKAKDITLNRIRS